MNEKEIDHIIQIINLYKKYAHELEGWNDYSYRSEFLKIVDLNHNKAMKIIKKQIISNGGF